VLPVDEGCDNSWVEAFGGLGISGFCNWQGSDNREVEASVSDPGIRMSPTRSRQWAQLMDHTNSLPQIRP
jgi:hypothetical protein